MMSSGTSTAECSSMVQVRVRDDPDRIGLDVFEMSLMIGCRAVYIGILKKIILFYKS